MDLARIKIKNSLCLRAEGHGCMDACDVQTSQAFGMERFKSKIQPQPRFNGIDRKGSGMFDPIL